MSVNRSGSILAADFGSVYTRALLIDVVDGVYRLIARGEALSTYAYPIDDVSVGLDRALRELSEVTGRQFVGGDGRVITPESGGRTGVDFFVATASLGRPLQTVLVGLVGEVSVNSGLRAAAGTYINIAEVISLDDGRSEEERLNAILLSRPDLIFITGGTDKGAENALLELSGVARLAVSLTDPKHKPLVVFAGNRMLHTKINALFEGLTSVLVADNVRPSLDEEHLEAAQLQLGKAFDEYKAQQGAGFQIVGESSNVGVLPTAQSYSRIVEYLGRIRPNTPITAVDMGSAVSIAATAFNDECKTSIRTDIGMGHSAYALLHAAGLEAVRQWIPFIVSPVEVVNYALNKSLRPATIPATVRDLHLEHALLRAGISHLVNSMTMQQHRQHNGVIIGAGSALTRVGSKAYTAMLLLDALQPSGITELYADFFGLIPALGALALVTPSAVVQLLDGDGLERLGTSVCVSGSEIKPGKAALYAKFVIDGEVFEQEIEGGTLWTLPLGTGKRINAELRVIGRGLHIGGKRKLKLTLEGGSAGVIFDARGRPLLLAADPAARAVQMPAWTAQVTGDPLIPIDERWLGDPKKQSDEADSSIAPPQRRGLFGRGAPKPAAKRTGGWFGRGKKGPVSAADRLADSAPDDLFDETPEHDEFADLRSELTKK